MYGNVYYSYALCYIIQKNRLRQPLLVPVNSDNRGFTIITFSFEQCCVKQISIINNFDKIGVLKFMTL